MFISNVKDYFTDMVNSLGATTPEGVSHLVVNRNAAVIARFQADEKDAEEDDIIKYLLSALTISPKDYPYNARHGNYNYGAYPLTDKAGKLEHMLVCISKLNVTEFIKAAYEFIKKQYENLNLCRCGKMVVITLTDAIGTEASSREYLYEGIAGDAAGVIRELENLVRQHSSEELQKNHVFDWVDFFHWFKSDLTNAGYIEVNKETFKEENLLFTDIINVTLSFGEDIVDRLVESQN